MSDARRRWFQIHLSTAIVLMFAAGGLLGLNILPFERGLTDWDLDKYPLDKILPKESWLFVAQGWPIPFWTAFEGNKQIRVASKWRYQCLSADVAIVLVILGAIAMCCEWRIRRRAREKNE